MTRYVHGYQRARGTAARRPGRRARRPAARRHRLRARRARPRARLRRRVADDHPGPPQSRRRRSSRSTSRPSRSPRRRPRVADGRPAQRLVRSGATCSPCRSAGVLRPRLRVLRPRAPRRPGRGAADRRRCSARRAPDRHRGRPRLGLLPPRQRRRPGRYRLARSSCSAAPAGTRSSGGSFTRSIAAAGFTTSTSRRWSSTSTAAARTWPKQFTRDTFTAMIEGVRADAVAAGLATAEDFDAGVRDLHRTSEPDGVLATPSSRRTRPVHLDAIAVRSRHVENEKHNCRRGGQVTVMSLRRSRA